MEFDDKTKMLVMVGAAQAVKCGPCLEQALAWAYEAGCSEETIAQALGVGTKVRDGSHKMLTDQAEEQLAETLETLGLKRAAPQNTSLSMAGASCPCSEA